MIRDRLYSTTTTVDEDTAEYLQQGPGHLRFITVQPPSQDSLPATLDRFIESITETSTRWLGMRNDSPTYTFEVVRNAPDTLYLRYGVPTKRLERKIRLHLTERLPQTTFTDTDGGLSVFEDVPIGGGHIEPVRRDHYPVQTDHDRPPLNHIISTLHRHAMQDTRFIVQLLFRPVAGQPLHQWWYRRRAFRQINHLKKEKEQLWGSRTPTSQERKRADAIEQKIGQPLFNTAIRVLVIGAGDSTPSRIKEVAGAFNPFNHPVTGQGFRFTVTQSLRERRIQGFLEAIHRRDLHTYTLPFHLSTAELAGMLALPDREQQNLVRATP